MLRLRYLWVVIFACFESLVYKADFQVSPQPGWGRCSLLGFFHWWLISVQKNTNKHFRKRIPMKANRTGSFKEKTYLSRLDSLCFLFLSSLPSSLPLSLLLLFPSSSTLCLCLSFSFSLSLWALLSRPVGWVEQYN